MKINPRSNQWQQLPESAIRRLQAEQLHGYLRSAVLPFSAYYKNLFRERGLTAESIRSLEDLPRLPFITKADLLNTTEKPQRFRDFILVPDEHVLARRPGTIFQALTRGRKFVRAKLEAEFRPIFTTFTTGRATEPVPVFYTQRDLGHLATAGRRVMEVCGGRREDRMMNAFPYAPHLAFWLAHYAGTEF
ncbi:MAG: phenylacetate--CoA ligase family protein, partial [Verrucomicrobiota bacterium]